MWAQQTWGSSMIIGIGSDLANTGDLLHSDTKESVTEVNECLSRGQSDAGASQTLQIQAHAQARDIIPPESRVQFH